MTKKPKKKSPTPTSPKKVAPATAAAPLGPDQAQAALDAIAKLPQPELPPPEALQRAMDALASPPTGSRKVRRASGGRRNPLGSVPHSRRRRRRRRRNTRAYEPPRYRLQRQLNNPGEVLVPRLDNVRTLVELPAAAELVAQAAWCRDHRLTAFLEKGPIDVVIEATTYTWGAPLELRRREVGVRSIGDILLTAARIYADIFDHQPHGRGRQWRIRAWTAGAAFEDLRINRLIVRWKTGKPVRIAVTVTL